MSNATKHWICLSTRSVAIYTPNRFPNTFSLNIYKLRDILSSSGSRTISSGLHWILLDKVAFSVLSPDIEEFHRE